MICVFLSFFGCKLEDTLTEESGDETQATESTINLSDAISYSIFFDGGNVKNELSDYEINVLLEELYKRGVTKVEYSIDTSAGDNQNIVARSEMSIFFIGNLKKCDKKRAFCYEHKNTDSKICNNNNRFQ